MADPCTFVVTETPAGPPARPADPSGRTAAFAYVRVDHLVRGQTRVSWELRGDYATPAPHTFQLQGSPSGIAEGDDWIDVGAPLVDGVLAVDAAARNAGMEPTWHYRVKLTDASGTSYSWPVGCFGTLSAAEWARARELIRKERLLAGRLGGTRGWLLKRRRAGTGAASTPRVRAAIDPISRGIIRPTRPESRGTEVVGGYYAPVPLDVMLDPSASYPQANSERGTADDAATFNRGRFVTVPQVVSRDVFVEDGTDLRYFVHEVRHIAEIRGVPLLATAEFRRAAFSDPIYSIAVPRERSDSA